MLPLFTTLPKFSKAITNKLQEDEHDILLSIYNNRAYLNLISFRGASR